MKKFTWLMIRFMVVMVPLVFVINGLTKHDWNEAFFFSLAVAVGLTPEMLPMIVSVCLSKGALAMSKKKVIVKRLNSIQNFGAMDVLCTDKTGTLTIDHVILEIHCDVFKNESEEVLRDAYLISHFQTGLKNVLDRAVLQYKELHSELSHRKIHQGGRNPVRFFAAHDVGGRRRSGRRAATADQGRAGGGVRQMHAFRERRRDFPDGADSGRRPDRAGQRIERRRFPRAGGGHEETRTNKAAYSKADECDLVLTGYLAFLDPPKDTAAKAIEALRQHGVTVKVLTGDNDLVTRKVCSEVGIHAEKILLGSQVETMSDAQLAEAVETHGRVRAALAGAQAAHRARRCRAKGHVVGFMGDGINDAPALRAADVGISVDNAVDIAKESADVILLEKNLMVLEEGVLEGRKVFVNILKYIRMGASSNFGNMFSVIGASAWLPYLPMAPIQVLTNNLLYDFSQVPIPTDNVGPQQIAKPRPWNMGEIAKFIVFIGPISSIFDYTTYAMMWFVFKCSQLGLVPPPELAARFANAVEPDDTYAAALFHTGWFVESLMTQTLIIHVIRTNLIPFIQSRASWQLTMTTLLIMAIGAYLPYSPLAAPLGFVPLAAAVLAAAAADAALLRRPDAGHQDLAGPQVVGLNADPKIKPFRIPRNGVFWLTQTAASAPKTQTWPYIHLLEKTAPGASRLNLDPPGAYVKRAVNFFRWQRFANRGPFLFERILQLGKQFFQVIEKLVRIAHAERLHQRQRLQAGFFHPERIRHFPVAQIFPETGVKHVEIIVQRELEQRGLVGAGRQGGHFFQRETKANLRPAARGNVRRRVRAENLRVGVRGAVIIGQLQVAVADFAPRQHAEFVGGIQLAKLAEDIGGQLEIGQRVVRGRRILKASTRCHKRTRPARSGPADNSYRSSTT